MRRADVGRSRFVRSVLMLVLQQELIDTQTLQALQLKEQLRDTKGKLMLQKQHDSQLHELLSRSMGRFEGTKEALVLAEEHVIRYKLCGECSVMRDE